jgi:hypothetical protein
MGKILKIRDGKIKTIYDDSIFDFLKKIGKVLIKRATHIEYDNIKGKWIATLADMKEDNIGKPGTLICEVDSRQEAIDQEIEFLKRIL